MNNIQLLSLNDIPFIKPNDNLIEIILDNLKNNNEIIEDNDVIVIAQKIICFTIFYLISLVRVDNEVFN